MEIITIGDLIKHKACEGQVKVFQDVFGNQVELTEKNLQKAIAEGLDISWADKRFNIIKRIFPLPNWVKNGASVQVKSCTEIEPYSSITPSFTSDMQKYCGVITKIKNLNNPIHANSPNRRDWFGLECDWQSYAWVHLWVKPVDL